VVELAVEIEVELLAVRAAVLLTTGLPNREVALRVVAAPAAVVVEVVVVVPVVLAVPVGLVTPVAGSRAGAVVALATVAVPALAVVLAASAVVATASAPTFRAEASVGAGMESARALAAVVVPGSLSAVVVVVEVEAAAGSEEASEASEGSCCSCWSACASGASSLSRRACQPASKGEPKGRMGPFVVGGRGATSAEGHTGKLQAGSTVVRPAAAVERKAGTTARVATGPHAAHACKRPGYSLGLACRHASSRQRT